MSDRRVRTTYAVAVRRTYAAAHTLQSSLHSDEENDRLFGKCANPHGHGHDYRFEFVVSASELTDGVVMNRGELSRCIDEHVMPRFDGRDLNTSFGNTLITSGENLAQAAWELLAPHLPARTTLCVQLAETRKNSFVYPA